MTNTSRLWHWHVTVRRTEEEEAEELIRALPQCGGGAADRGGPPALLFNVGNVRHGLWLWHRVRWPWPTPQIPSAAATQTAIHAGPQHTVLWRSNPWWGCVRRDSGKFSPNYDKSSRQREKPRQKINRLRGGSSLESLLCIVSEAEWEWPLIKTSNVARLLSSSLFDNISMDGLLRSQPRLPRILSSLQS